MRWQQPGASSRRKSAGDKHFFVAHAPRKTAQWWNDEAKIPYVQLDEWSATSGADGTFRMKVPADRYVNIRLEAKAASGYVLTTGFADVVVAGTSLDSGDFVIFSEFP